MNVEPYSDDEIADARTHLSCDDEYDRCHYHDVAHWLATVDALRARLAAAEAAAATAKVAADLLRHRAERAEARNERMRQALEDAKMAMMDVLEEGHSGDYGATPEDMRPVVRRIEALLKEVSHGQQG